MRQPLDQSIMPVVDLAEDFTFDAERRRPTAGARASEVITYFDLDDTLADFRGAAIACGVSEGFPFDPHNEPASSSDEDLEMIWSAMLSPGFFEMLEPLPGARAAVEIATGVGRVGIITSLPRGIGLCHQGHRIAAEKRRWVERVLDGLVDPRMFHCVLFGTKASLVGFWGERTSVLVDDSQANLRDWEGAGGIAVRARAEGGASAGIAELLHPYRRVQLALVE